MKTMAIYEMLVVVVIGVTASLSGVAKGNLISNGGFEADPDGTQVTGNDFIETATITDWRAFAVGGAGATFTVAGAAARSGAVGMEIAYDAAGADSALDRDASRVGIPAQERIYKQLVDVRDGGAHGGSGAFGLGFQFFSAGPFTGGRGYGMDPQAGWETTGLTARSHTGDTDLAVRYNVNLGESVYLDDVEIVDATVGMNRMINGGFENSSTRLSDWRFFAVAGAAGSATLNNDAASGSSAALLERTAAAGDSGLDIDPLRLATLGGETLQIDFASKKVSGTSDSRIRLSVATFNDGGGFLGDILADLYDPGTAAYENFSTDVTLNADVAFVNVGFRIFDAANAASVGAYLIDDVSIVGIPEPVSLVLLLVGGVGLTVCRWRCTVPHVSEK